MSDLDLSLPSPRLPPRKISRRAGGIGALAVHLAAAAALMWTAHALPARGRIAQEHRDAGRVASGFTHLVFVHAPGPGGGGGGGGNRDPKPPSRASAPGRDRITLTVATPIRSSEQPPDLAPPPHSVVLDAVSLTSGTALLTGMPEAPAGLAFSQGPGSGGGVGTGRGSGEGTGSGPGYGQGSGGGFGGGVYRPGNGVSAPTLVRRVNPVYTPEAMQRKIQGSVTLEAVVGEDGAPREIRVIRSLDAGLDNEAIKAARQWQFAPGRLGDTPVVVLVRIVMDFRMF